MDKVKINSITGKLVNATFTFDDVQIEGVVNAIKIAPVTVNLNGMTVSDGDILANELNKIGQEYKANAIANIPSDKVAASVGSEFGYDDGIIPIIPEVAPEVPADPETPSE